MNTPTEDQNLIRGIADRDREAFAHFFDRHSARVLGLLVKMLGQRGEAEDVLQETFLQVWNRANRYNPERSNPVVWLVMIARSRAIDHIRRRKGNAIPVALEELAEPKVSRNGHGDLAKRARVALKELPEEQRYAIGLAFFCGLTHERVAEHQSIPLGTAKTRIRRGVHRLREILDESLGGSTA